MKKTIYLIVALAILSLGRANASDVLEVNAPNVPLGGTAEMAITCSLDNQYTAFSFEIELPEGLSFQTDNNNWLTVKPGEGFTATNHEISGSKLSNGNYLLTCISSNTAVKEAIPSNGILVTLTIIADETLTIGESYTGRITNSEFTSMDTQAISLADVEFTVSITEFRTILDENDTTAPVAEENANVQVKRTINANTWSTICLPFAMTEAQVKTAFGDDVLLGDFTGYDVEEDGEGNVVAISVNFSGATSIAANHPYIIYVSSSMTSFTVDGVDVEPEDEPSVSFGTTTGSGKNKKYHPSDFVGTYVADYDFYNAATSYPVFLSGSKFYYATESTRHMKAYRAFFDFDDYLPELDESNAPNISLSFNGGDGNTTGIDAHTMQHTEAGKVYSLAGQYVGEYTNKSHLPKGIYIVNGKKTVIM